MKQIFAFILIIAGLFLISSFFGDEALLKCKTTFKETNQKLVTRK